MSRTLSIGFAASKQRFDTNFKFTDKSSGLSAFIDGEGTLGLPEIQNVKVIYGYWRPSEKHGIGFEAFRINRSTTLLAFDEDLDDLIAKTVEISDIQNEFVNASRNERRPALSSVTSKQRAEIFRACVRPMISGTWK